ncbi:hypothetical protein JL720_16615 [Aureococcus anophagefferens]|nr:hypothetical protein JL720_16615 [Aureococcus anophagefferens]
MISISAVGRSVAEYDRRQSASGPPGQPELAPDSRAATRPSTSAGSDSDEPDDPCESPFYGGLGAQPLGLARPGLRRLDLVDGGRPLWPPASRFDAASSWGASVVAHDGAHWIFVSEMAAGCGLATWRSNSMVAVRDGARPRRPRS